MSLLPPAIVSAGGLPPEQLLGRVCTSGRPFAAPGFEVGVFNAADERVAADGQEVGEVRCRGPTVFPGYWRRPEATWEAFRRAADDPAGAPWWFCTGDLAVMRADGYLRVVDRAKDMVLVGGENVYTAEVEAALAAHPRVQQAAVFGLPNAVMGELVAAAVVLRPGAGASGGVARELQRWCAERLSAFKVPSAVHVLPAMPTTGSGKVLKSELRRTLGGTRPASAAAVADAAPAPMAANASRQPAAAPPPEQNQRVAAVAAPPAAAAEPSLAGVVEARVSRAACDALRLGEGEALGPEESLWARGLSSLGAVGLSAQLESELGVELPPTLAFDFVSVRALARFVAARLPPQKAQPAAVAAVPPQPSIDPGKPKPPETQALLPRMLAPAFAADEEEPSMLLQVPPPALPQRAAAFPPLSPPPPPPPPPTSLPPQPESAGALLSGASPLAALQGAVQGAVRDALWGVEVDYKTPLMARHLFFP